MSRVRYVRYVTLSASHCRKSGLHEGVTRCSVFWDTSLSLACSRSFIRRRTHGTFANYEFHPSAVFLFSASTYTEYNQILLLPIGEQSTIRLFLSGTTLRMGHDFRQVRCGQVEPLVHLLFRWLNFRVGSKGLVERCNKSAADARPCRRKLKY